MRHNESKLQQQCIKWICLQYPNIICMAIPNGGKRSRTEAAIMKAEGVYAGAADLFIPLCNGKWYGLFIEMKSKTGRLTDNQMAFRDKVLYNRYSYVVCRDLDEFVIKINDYMSLVT